MKAAIRLMTALACLAMLACTDSPTRVVDGGGGSEAVGLTGMVRNPDQTPALQARVRLRPRLFLQDTVPGLPAASLYTADTVTDDSGTFHLDSLEPGEYYLEIRDDKGQGLLLPFAVTGLNPKVDLGAAVLKPTGSVSGSFLAPDGFKGRTYVQVYGMERLVLADSASGRFRLDSLPVGTYTLRALYSAPAVDPLEVGSVPSTPAGNTDIGSLKLGSFELENYGLWPRYMRMVINTTADGADVKGLVTDFPLLVRLSAANFNFSEARGDGRDIRFSDARGKRLRFEIERWDSAAALAEIWVRADVVQGNSKDQFITMHWGAPNAMDWSDGRAVFERDYGFSGVWHLKDEAAGIATDDLYADAVGLNPADDRVSAADKTGVAGLGASFDGDDYIQVPVADPVLKPLSRVFVSAWFKAVTTGPNGANIVSMGDNYNLRVTKEGWGRISLYDGSTRFIEAKSRSLLDGAWHHLSGAFDGSAMSLYVDGAEAARIATTAPLKYNKSPNFVIGRHGDNKSGYDFTGALDEVVVASEIRSSDWIKLTFESQRPGSKLLEFVP